MKHFSKKPFSPTHKATEETNSTPVQCIQNRHQTSSSVKFFYLPESQKNKRWNAGTRQAQESGRWISFAWHWNESLVSRVSCIIFSLSSLHTHHPVRTERFLLPGWETWHHSQIHKSIKTFIFKVSFFWCLSWKKILMLVPNLWKFCAAMHEIKKSYQYHFISRKYNIVMRKISCYVNISRYYMKICYYEKNHVITKSITLLLDKSCAIIRKYHIIMKKWSSYYVKYNIIMRKNAIMWKISYYYMKK